MPKQRFAWISRDTLELINQTADMACVMDDAYILIHEKKVANLRELLPVLEAVSQLRSEAGVRQVPGARIALSTGAPGYVGGVTSALLLRRGT